VTSSLQHRENQGSRKSPEVTYKTPIRNAAFGRRFSAYHCSKAYWKYGVTSSSINWWWID